MSLYFNTHFFAWSNGLPGVSPIFNLFKWLPILKNLILFSAIFLGGKVATGFS
jgi:hypothetical protein